MLSNKPIAIKNTTSELLPKLTNGRGIPVTGMMPMVIPMFTNTWNTRTPATPAAISRPYMSSDSRAMRNARQMMTANSPSAGWRP